MATTDILDTVVTAETPEGILLELRPAGLTARCYAFVVDWLIRIAVLYAVQMAAVFAGGIGIALWLILFFALEWFYPVAFELTPSGATPGKRVFSLRVLMDNGLPITAAASVTRNLLRFADFFPFGYGFAIVSILLRRDCKRLGDLAAGTIVVYATREVSPAPLDTGRAGRAGAAAGAGGSGGGDRRSPRARRGSRASGSTSSRRWPRSSPATAAAAARSSRAASSASRRG